MEIVINILVWTLAFYGLFEIIKNIIYICTCTKLSSDGIYFIVAVKNQENCIENFIRNIMFKIIYGREEKVKNIILVDLNSTDQTECIVEKLQKEYEQIKVINWKECRELIENIEEN